MKIEQITRKLDRFHGLLHRDNQQVYLKRVAIIDPMTPTDILLELPENEQEAFHVAQDMRSEGIDPIVNIREFSKRIKEVKHSWMR